MKYEILKKELKNVLSEGESPLVKYSISYPEICGKTEFSKVFNGFYSMLARRFEDFAKTKLRKESARFKMISPDEHLPFGAVMKYICSYCEKDVISVVVDASVFSGNEHQEVKRLSQNWDVLGGRLLLFEDFFSPDDKKTIINGIIDEFKLQKNTGLNSFYDNGEKIIKKNFSKNDFYLTPKGYGFFYQGGLLSERKTADVFFLLGFSGKGKYNPYEKN